MACATSSPPAAVLVLEPKTANVSQARRFVVDAIGSAALGLQQDAALLTSEIVSNAVAHASTRVKVRVKRHGDRARVEVYDGSDERLDPGSFTTDREGGRGLAIVDAVADEWGVTPVDDHGKVVWFELCLSRVA